MPLAAKAKNNPRRLSAKTREPVKKTARKSKSWRRIISKIVVGASQASITVRTDQKKKVKIRVGKKFLLFWARFFKLGLGIVNWYNGLK